MISRRRPLPALTALFLVLMFGPAAPIAAAQDAPPPWHSTVEAAHPLVGRIWRVADGVFVDPAVLARALARHKLVLLGETHDNPDHHRIQAWAVGQVAAAGGRPAIALEMIAADRQARVDAHFKAHPSDVAGLGDALGWDKTGWPAWRHYGAVVAAAGRSPAVIGANLPRTVLRAVARDGFNALGPERRRALALDRPLPEPLYAALDAEIVAVHCGQIPAGRARAFTNMQIARDAALADGLLAAARAVGNGHAVLIAGAGHVRRDRGVPLHLARRDAGDVLSLTAIEVRAGITTPRAYAEAYGTTALPFDYVWFTPRMERDNPCK